MKIHIGQNLKYISNVTMAINNVVVLSIQKENSADPSCGFHYTNQRPKRVTKRSLEKTPPEKFYSSSPPA